MSQDDVHDKNVHSFFGNCMFFVMYWTSSPLQSSEKFVNLTNQGLGAAHTERWKDKRFPEYAIWELIGF